MRVEKVPPEARGWIAGDFDGAVIQTDGFEVGLKSGLAEDKEELHYHTSSYEHTYVIRGTGTVRLDEGVPVDIGPGCVITVRPLEVVAWDWDEDWATLVVRTPAITNDKRVLV